MLTLKFWRLACPVMLCVLLCAQSAAAQTVTGAVSGTVVDGSGNAVAGATVKLVNERTNDARVLTTNESGDFRFTAVLPGIYTVKVEQKGFSSFERRGNVLTANEHLAVGDLAMKVGELSETVTTVAEGTPVQTESTEHSALLSSKQLELISQRGRDVTTLLKILPGVSYGGESESLGGGFGSGIPNIQGGRNTWNTLNVDGVRGNDLGSPNIFSSSINFDAIGEVKVLLNSYQAEYASNSSASVNIVTKSGSSEYHGTGYWFKRHEQFNANNFFNNASVVTSPQTGLTSTVPKPRYRYSTLGATFSGPVWLPTLRDKFKDKLFFFYSFEDSQTLNPQVLRQATVPTELERNGDFSQTRDVNNALIVIRDPVTNAPFPGNVIPANRINKNGQALLKVFPAPNAPDRAISRGQYNNLFQESLKVPKRQHLFRIDYRPSEKNSFYVRGSTWYADNQGSAVPAGTANSQVGLGKLHYTFTDNGIVGSWTRVFSSNMVNESSLSVRHSVEKGPPLSEEELNTLRRATYGFTLGQFFPQLNPLGVLPLATFGGVTNPPQIAYDGRFPLRGADTLISFNDTFSLIHGNHTFKAGFYFERARNYEGATATFAGNFSFARDTNNPLDSNYAYSNALLGNFQSYTESTFRPSGEGRQSLADWFIQDSWKATRRLSFEFGVRFGWFNQWYQDTANSAAFVLSRYDRAKAPQYYQPGCTVAVPAGGTCAAANRRARNPVTGALFPAVLIGAFVPGTGDPYNGMTLGRDDSYPRGFKDQQPVQVQPRFGFAWDVKGDGKLAIRGSAGVFNQTRVSANAIWTDVARNPPIADNPRIFYGNLDTLLSSAGTLFPSNVTGFDPDAPTPVTYNYTLSVQKDVGFGTVVDVAYVGSVSRHLQQQRNINQIPYRARHLDVNPQNANPTVANTPLPDDFLRPFPGYGSITYYENAGLSNYNALQVAVNRRFIRGLQFGVAYTYSKTMDYVDNDRDGAPTFRPLRIWNYGRAGFDQTHVMVINYTWDLPRATRLWDNKVVKAVFDDWQLSGLTAFASGTPAGVGYTLVDGADITGGGDGGRIIITGNPNLSEDKQTVASTGFVQWINPAAFARPARGDFGNAPKDVFRNPGTHNWDFSLFKNIPLKSESRRLQLRWEIYNAFNHTQWSSIDATARFDASGNQVNPRFGQVTGARTGRVMQGSLRLTF
ncbi:MAG TPA: carboxypeptidase regulatory-like domain-containing protein [Blastocatellia bacterium]|nr:carboxypeptidase regulatory-like domain-containing protein [Blastocatellia bacterium]